MSTVETKPLTNWEVIRWWEIRRLLFNGMLLVIGFVSLAGMEYLLGKVMPIDQGGMAAFGLAWGVVFYGVAANVCYTAGWIMELLGRKGGKSLARHRARKLFVLGLWLSGALTTAPLWFGLVYWYFHRS